MAGFWQNILSSFSGGSAFMTPRVTYLGASEFAAMANPSSMTAAQMWESQPHFRTVVTFIARNIAQLGLHSFERVDQTDRRRDRESVLAQSVHDVDGHMTTFELVFALVGDLALYDRAYWWAAPSSEMPSGWMIRRLPPTWVEPVMANPWEVKEYKAYIREDAAPEIIPADKVLAFPGYHPGKMHGSSPTVDALRQTLQEQVEAATYRSQVWKRGGRASSVIERPASAPGWTEAQADRFRADWYANFTGNGPRAGGTPVLEDGMQLKRIDFNAQEQQYVEAAKLSLTTVASAFHVNPTMIGQNDGANYSNVREFRKMLYGDTLGPMVAQIEGRINTFLIPRMGLDRRRFYVEFNINEKLQGNFEEQAAQLQTATGGPYMTRNEARAMQNLPALEGANELIVPLNVITGGQASPTDSGTQNISAAPRRAVKSGVSEFEIKAPEEIPEDHQKAMAKVFAEFFARQRRSVLSAAGAKSPEWWDGDRWDEELTEDLLGQSLKVSEAAALTALAAMGEDPDKYSVDRTKAFLKAVSERIARQVNAATQASLEDAFEDDDPEAPGHVFDVAEESRAAQSGMTAAATYVGFGMVEAARQTKPQAMKRWQVNSGNPRSSHAGVNGEEVPIDDDFSNGLKWPGSFNGDVEEVANCQCSVVIIT
ncbi:portal protein [Arthrobacter phage Shoya]|uniref:Portal and MuF-like fusion protein n=1 Tax=Arthrobacter phage Shoya TaxID=2704035 RepID=A0A6G6XI34_9CAUD|nr:portal protein [Arthrobacter phage Shoya]QIG57674.1 portal and MuF-like fusion protein [Arthrobacter phage Shoya]